MTAKEWIALLLLSLWASTSWLTADLLPSQLPPTAALGLHFLWFGLAALVWTVRPRKRTQARLVRVQTVQVRPDNIRPGEQSRALLRVIVPGLGVYAAPFLLLQAAGTGLSPSLSTLVYALFPLPVLLVAASAGSGLRLLGYPVAAVAGLLLLIPVSVPAAPRAWVALALCLAAMILTAASLVALHTRLRGLSLPRILAAICLSNAVLLLAIGITQGVSAWTVPALEAELFRAALLDAPQVVLFLWLARRVAPHRLAARYLFAPLFTALEGYAAMRPGLDFRALAGLLLLAAGATLLARATPEEPANQLNLL